MKQLTIPANLENLYTAIEFISENVGDVSDAVRGEIEMAVEEVFVNIAHYAYPNLDGEIEVCISSDEQSITIEFVDSGVEFNPLEKPDPKAPETIEETMVGGLGIFMVKDLMDSVTYEREGNKNILTISKNKGV